MEKRDTTWIEARAAAYFAACDATRESTPRKDGSLAVRQVPYTMAGLAAALGMDRPELERRIAAGRRDAATRALRVAAARVEQHTVERALMGELHAAAADTLLKGWGYGASPEAEGGRIVVALEDREGFGR